ncbi:IS3 family transposase [Serratia sp. J2]|uniref:IS3 family transposase n=1 Tax=Serratia sp. J2 TaxID=3386551 RepID=UPI0039172681
MAKHSLEFRLSVVNFYLSGNGYKKTGQVFGIHRDTVSQWVNAFQQHGVDGITWKNDNHPPQFKLSVVEVMLAEGLTVREATARFNISDKSVVRRWFRVYSASGAEGLLKLSRGNSKPLNKKTKKTEIVDLELRPPEELTQEELHKELRYLRAENAYLKKPEGLSSTGEKRKKSLIINELRLEYPLADLLQVAGMSRSTWYYNIKASRRTDKHGELKDKISEIYHYHKGRYGYRRITLSLRKQGYNVNHKAVQRLMSELSLQALVRVKKYRSWVGEVGKTAPNLLNRKFCANKPNEKWVTDVTEFNVRGEKLYLSPVIDLFNREVVSYSMSDRPVMSLINTMLEKAIAKLGKDDTPMLHSDQGWQYQMAQYQQRLQREGVVQSMSRKGNCLDNAVAESFFGTLKSECFYLSEFNSITELRKTLDEYIHYYNNERISLRLKGLSPVEYRTQA